jgi:hypothetical protein
MMLSTDICHRESTSISHINNYASKKFCSKRPLAELRSTKIVATKSTLKFPNQLSLESSFRLTEHNSNRKIQLLAGKELKVSTI